MQEQKYLLASRQLLDQAKSELASGDVRQASEKGWGAAAQMVKAIADQRGWPHRGHALLYEAVGRLVTETGDPEIGRLFDIANSLHINFYEDWRDSTSVLRAVNDVEQFLDNLEPLL